MITTVFRVLGAVILPPSAFLRRLPKLKAWTFVALWVACLACLLWLWAGIGIAGALAFAIYATALEFEHNR